MAVKVSVVVPVYNPGSNIDDCIASLLRQSLPTDEYEAIFVDDGSTDGTGERLDALAAEHPHVTVHHIPNSGWPGRPRNVGIDAAKGKYVYFVDNDDFINDEALERLYEYAEQNRSDVVIGKVAGRGRRIPREVFRTNLPRGVLGSDPLLALLTPHKLFRKEFLDEHGIRFPEGRRRLEDHVFVMQAYFRAEVISVLADYPCYYWVRRADKTNASFKAFDPVGYFDNLREVLDIVEANTAPGDERDRLLVHWYRLKLLSRMGGRKLLGYPPDYRRELYTEIRRLAEERFGPGVVARMPMSMRVRSRVLRTAGYEDLETLAAVESGLRADLRIVKARWDAGALALRLRGNLTYADGSPVLFRRSGDSVHWVLPPALADLSVEPSDTDVSAELRRSKIGVTLHACGDGTEFMVRVRSKLRPHGDDTFGIAVEASGAADPLVAAAGRPLWPATWEIRGFLRTCGWDVAEAMPSIAPEVVEGVAPALLGEAPLVVRPARAGSGALRVQLAQDVSALAGASLEADARVCSVTRDERELRLSLQLPVVAGGSASLPAELELRPVPAAAESSDSSGPVVTSATLSQTATLARLDARVALDDLATDGSGTWALALRSGKRSTPLDLLLDVEPTRAPVLRNATPRPAPAPAPAPTKTAASGRRPSSRGRRLMTQAVRRGKPLARRLAVTAEATARQVRRKLQQRQR